MMDAIETIETIKTIKPQNKKRRYVKVLPKYELTYQNYINNNINFKLFSLFDIKTVCKKYKLKISGTKTVLITRLEYIFIKNKSVIKIQSNVRRWMVGNMIRLRGPALHNKSLCINECDFVSLERLTEIQSEYFYSYIDVHGFVYGFNIISLIQMIALNKGLTNPYNREILTKPQVILIIRLFNITMWSNAEFRKTNAVYNTIHVQRYLYDNLSRIQNRTIINVSNRRIASSYQNYNPIITLLTIYPEQQIKLDLLESVRKLPIIQRIDKLFIEIDSLGNYSQSEWFHSLSLWQYIRLYRILYDIWNYRDNLTPELKHNISPFHSPFSGLFNDTNRHTNITETHNAQLICMNVFENILYSGISDEYRKIGAMHLLTALTCVSVQAREAIPWLYDSIDF